MKTPQNSCAVTTVLRLGSCFLQGAEKVTQSSHPLLHVSVSLAWQNVSMKLTAFPRPRHRISSLILSSVACCVHGTNADTTQPARSHLQFGFTVHSRAVVDMSCVFHLAFVSSPAP